MVHKESERSEAVPLLRVEGLDLQFGEQVIQAGLSFAVAPGEIFAVVGVSGCGKSTLLRALLGLHPVKRGRIWHGETDFLAATAATKRSCLRRVGVSYQSGALWSSLSLAENIALPLRYFGGLDEGAIRETAERKLGLVGLDGWADVLPAQLSGGMRKRAALARALTLDPPLLFFDEPQAGLDPVTARRLDDLILELRDSLGTGFVMVTHELRSLFRLADRLLFLDAEAGRATAMGVPEALRTEPPNEAVGAFLNP